MDGSPASWVHTLTAIARASAPISSAPMTSSTQKMSPTNLPSDITSFVGRRREVTQARALISRNRLVTFTGVGGVGKTRLSARVGHDLRSAFSDGVWLVELAEVEDQALVAHAAITELGWADHSNEEPLLALTRYLVNKKVLLILDNCEHLLEAVSDMAFNILRECPDVHILATSREPLGITGEWTLPVPPLSVPSFDGSEKPDNLVQYESVSLFVERASAGSPAFALNDENAALICKMCQEMEGIPLAIELAAVRVRSLPLEHIVSRLSDRFNLLTSSSSTAPTRQQTLHASVEWSYDLCSSQEQLLWQRLSVFSGGFELDAAEAICSSDDLPAHTIADRVASLLDKSVLTRDGRGSRYRMLETLREFGLDRLRSNASYAALKAQHRDWFQTLAGESHTRWISIDQVAALRRLRHEHANLRTAFNYSISEDEGVESALLIASDLEHYWLTRGRLTEGRQWLDQALSQVSSLVPARASALRVNAYLATLQGYAELAQDMLEEAKSIALVTDNPAEVAYIDMVVGICALSKGLVDEAMASLYRALDQFRVLDERTGQAYALVTIATAAVVVGDLDLAARCHEKCMELTVEQGELHLRAFSLWARGLVALRTGELELAVELERESLRLKHRLGDNFGIAVCIESLAWAAVSRGRYEHAAKLIGAAEQFWGPMSMTVGAISGLDTFREEYERELRTALGEEAFRSAQQAGARFDQEQTFNYAQDDVGPDQVLNEGLSLPPLTKRESEIAELIGAGLTNRQIAAKLLISQRTAETHVEHILSKLSFNSRVQIASWVADARSKFG